MKWHLRNAAVLILAICIEQSVLPFLAPGGVSLRLGTLWAISVAMQRGRKAGAVAGFLAGVLISLVSQEKLGIASLALVCVAWAAGSAASRFPLGGAPLVALLVMVLLLLESAITFLAGWTFFGVAYGFNYLDLVVASLASPVTLHVLRHTARPERAPDNPAWAGLARSR